MNLNPSQTAFLFPGQGSQKIGMGQDLADAYPSARAIFAQADALLGFPLSEIAWRGPEEQLNDTINTQPALLVHSAAVLRVFWEEYPDFEPAFVAGHSLGELSALVAAGVLSFADTLHLVRRRGELMKEAGTRSPGGMAAILGLDIPTVEGLCKQAVREGEVVQIANDNCPGQIVVSGSGPVLRRLVPLAMEAGAKRIIPLMVSIAAHSPLMAHAEEGFQKAVASARLSEPRIPIIGNVSATPLKRARDVEDDLNAQLTSRVRWIESIAYLLSEGVTHFLEMGTGSVLCSLLRRIDRTATRIPLGTPEDFEKVIAS